jgi:hypothetical protein
MPVIYTFEAKSIQPYIFESSKLRDMVGASEQIENLTITHGLLDKVLQALNLQSIKFSRKAGGAFIAILDTQELAKKLRDLWTFTIRYSLPGLEFVQGLQEYQTDAEILTAESQTYAQKLADRNRLYPVFPIAGPLVARCPRTGEPAITEKTNPTERGTERLDKRTILKRRFLEKATKSGTGLALENKLNLETAYQDQLIWPKNLDPKDNEANEQHFPLLGENRYIGIIHANGNGLGQLLMQVRKDIENQPQHYAQVFKALSETIEQATVAAAKQATRSQLVPQAELRHDAQGNALKIMPARPLVLGGDDLTMIVRGNLAIPFTAKFLEAFEEQSEKLLTAFQQTYKKEKGIELHLPKGLTACAGISFIKVSQPFYLAYDLAESLSKTAKTRSKQTLSKDGRIPSSLAFHRITTSIIDDYKSICQRELTTPAGWLLTMQPYAVGKIHPAPGATHFPSLYELDNLRRLLTEEKVSHGAMRELLNLLHLSPKRAERAFKRWRENMRIWARLTEFQQVLEKLIGKTEKELPILSAEEGIKRTPLADALAWNGIARGSDV